MADDYLDEWENPKQCAAPVRAIEELCSHMKDVGAGIKAGRDSLGDVLQYTYEAAYEAKDAAKKHRKGSKKRASLEAKALAAEMLHHFTDEIRDGYYDEFLKEAGYLPSS